MNILSLIQKNLKPTTEDIRFALRAIEETNIFENVLLDDNYWLLPDGENLYTTEMITLRNGSVIKPFCLLEGPIIIMNNVTLGPSSYLRKGVVIGSGSIIGHAVEIVNSIIGQECRVLHKAYIGYSFIGSFSLFGASFTTAVLRKDGDSISVRNMENKNVLFNSDRLKLGVITGYHAWVGCHVVTMPGTYIPNKFQISPFASIGGSNFT